MEDGKKEEHEGAEVHREHRDKRKNKWNKWKIGRFFEFFCVPGWNAVVRCVGFGWWVVYIVRGSW